MKEVTEVVKPKDEEKQDNEKEDKPKEKRKKQYKVDEDLLLAFRFFDKNGASLMDPYRCGRFQRV